MDLPEPDPILPTAENVAFARSVARAHYGVPLPGEIVAGRELDALIATKVMGWAQTEGMYGRLWWGEPNGNHQVALVEGPSSEYEVFCPSTDIAASWQVVERIAALRQGEDEPLSGPAIFRLEGPDSDGEYQAGFVFDNTLDCMHLSWEGGQGEYANTTPLAICRAALRTVGVVPESV